MKRYETWERLVNMTDGYLIHLFKFSKHLLDVDRHKMLHVPLVKIHTVTNTQKLQ